MAVWLGTGLQVLSGTASPCRCNARNVLRSRKTIATQRRFSGPDVFLSRCRGPSSDATLNFSTLSLGKRPPSRSRSLMNLPNVLTLARIFLVPLLLAVLLRKDAIAVDTGWVVFTREAIALLIFLSAALTDLLDGYLARRRRQVTTFGKLLDPIADKLLVSAALISLVELDRVPAWMVVLIVSREFAVSALRYLALTEGVTIAASDLGKAKMVTQVTAVALLLLAPHSPTLEQAGYIALWLAVLITVWSMVDYFRAFWRRPAAAAESSVETDEAMVIRKNLPDASNRS